MSASVATVTAGLTVTVGGGAMGARSSDDTAPSSDAGQAPQTEAQAEPAMPVAKPATVVADANPSPPPAIAPGSNQPLPARSDRN